MPSSICSRPSAAGSAANCCEARISATGCRPSKPRATTATSRTETDLEELARILINLHSEGMDHEEVQLLYAQHVLGYTIAELATTSGRERRALYTRRDRGQRRLCASAG